jgi:hypothetical protein
MHWLALAVGPISVRYEVEILKALTVNLGESSANNAGIFFRK